MTKYLPGSLEGGAGYAIWDAEARGGPIQRFPADDEGWNAVRAQVQELIRSDPGTKDVLAWIRREGDRVVGEFELEEASARPRPHRVPPFAELGGSQFMREDELEPAAHPNCSDAPFPCLQVARRGTQELLTPDTRDICP